MNTFKTCNWLTSNKGSFCLTDSANYGSVCMVLFSALRSSHAFTCFMQSHKQTRVSRHFLRDPSSWLAFLVEDAASS
ncbi:hypothetical protein GUJ93_ZPchr0002g24535 [Zizania palustris]|uniref:Uncharacterized protein n=1 Tax=Zizania palustris TaxID=103762 RepID=A0A8J5VGE9_ZIZPA|nr:hypothetical protein GUJ93_ZPchr0002g24535 [Zizania palustris]